MRDRAGLVLPGAASVGVGFVLMAIPVALVLTGSVLNLIWTVLLWVGFAEIVIGAVLLALAVTARPAPVPAGAPAYDVDDSFDEAPLTPSE